MNVWKLGKKEKVLLVVFFFIFFSVGLGVLGDKKFDYSFVWVGVIRYRWERFLVTGFKLKLLL